MREACLSELIRRHRDDIVAHWTSEARALPGTRLLPISVLAADVPPLLDEIALVADSASPETHELPRAAAHATARNASGVPLHTVIAEYKILRRHLLRAIDDGARERLDHVVDRFMEISVEIYEEANQRVLHTLDRVSELALTGELPIERLLVAFIEVARDAVSVDTTSVLLRDGDALRVRAAAGFEREVDEGFAIPVGEGFAGTIAATRAPLLLRDPATSPLVRNEVIKTSGMRALYGAPLVAGDDVIGVVHMGSRRAPDFADGDKKLFHALAHRLVAVIGYAVLRARERAALVVARVFNRAASVDEAGAALLGALGSAFSWTVGAFWRVDETSHVLRVHTTWTRDDGAHSAFVAASLRTVLAKGEGLPGSAWKSGATEWRRDVTTAANFPRAEAAAAEGLRAGVAFPLKVDERVLGVIELFSTEPRSPLEESVHVPRVIAEQLGELVRRLAAQEALRASENEKTAILDSALDAVVGMDEAGDVIAWNPAAARIFGYSTDEAIGRRLAELIIPERWREAHRRGLARFREGGRGNYVGRRLEVHAMRKGGGELLVELSILALSLPSGKHRFTGFVRDITAQKRAEEGNALLADATRVLVSSLDEHQVARELARITVPRFADMCIVDLLPTSGPPVLAVAHVDPAGEQLLREIRGRWPIKGAHPIAEVIGTGKVRYVTVDDAYLERTTVSREHADAVRSLHMRCIVSVALEARGRRFGVITFATTAHSGRDLVEADVAFVDELAQRASLAMDNAHLYAAEQRAVHIRDDVLAIVSHDLKNPLGAITLSADSMMRRFEHDDAVRPLLETVQRSARRMSRLIRDLLDMASIQAARLAIEPSPQSAASLAREAMELHAPLAQERGITLDLDDACGAVTVLCDRDRTLQVFANLLGNAIKFSKPDGVITIACVPGERDVSFSVTDDGPGIAADELPRLFEPYWSARRHAKKGTGLGLYISKGIVEAQGGTISVTSAPGRTQFQFTVPIINRSP